MLFLQLIIDQLTINEIIEKTMFYNFYIDDPISIVVFCLCGILALSSVILSKITRLNSFLIYSMFLLGWTGANYMVFTFAMADAGTLYINLVTVY